jgi:16S rRNA (cytidine1402-2'-O)-methyltransferase
MARVMPERRIAVVREITKLHEETVIGFPAEILRDQESGIRNQWRGEIVIVAEPAPDVKMSDDEIAEIVRDVVGTRGNAPAKSVAAEISARTGLSKSEAYEMVVKE